MPVKTHGLSYKHPLWSTWKTMRTRCNNPNSISYKNYGAKGIKVCKRWDNFANFIQDMGDKPTPQHSLDRIDNSKGYSPDNCRWATRSQQNANQIASGASGIKGVYYIKNISKWASRTCKYHGTIYLGVYETPQKAEEARLKAGCKYNEHNAA